MAAPIDFEVVRQTVLSVLDSRDKEKTGYALELVDQFLTAVPDHPVAAVMKGCVMVLKASALLHPIRKAEMASAGLALMDQAMERVGEAESYDGPGADVEMRMLRGLVNAMIPAKFRRNEIVRADLTAVLDHPFFPQLTAADQARAKAWLAVTLHRDGDAAGAEDLLATARKLDAGIADAAWAER